MKTIGLIGGMSWESTQMYYRLINQHVNALKGGFHSAKMIVNSVDFAPIVDWQKQDDWASAADCLARAAQQLQRAGCDGLALATNTMHLVIDEVQAAVTIPFVHIVEPTGRALCQQQIKRVALLGTRFTMEKTFYTQRLQQQFGVETLIPSASQRDDIHRIIYEELCRGSIRDESRQRFIDIIADLQQQGAQAVILGCTEIGLLLRPHDVVLPQFDTTLLHAQALAKWSVSEN